MTKVSFFCQSCGNETPKWHGKCPACNQWNTLKEQMKTKVTKKRVFDFSSSSLPKPVQEINSNCEIKIETNDDELDVVLGGGIVPGSVILLAGQPGIGKSTLLLQVALKIKTKVLYVSGEEAQTQIKIRANRIGFEHSNCHVYSETSCASIINHCKENFDNNASYNLIVIDSIQTLYSDLIDSPIGSVNQIKQCCAELVNFAKSTNTPIILIGHITKEGQIAGPKILEHMVDVVLNFEGDRNFFYRILRAQKNRYGTTDKVGVYEMKSMGLVTVKNPSNIMLQNRSSNFSGTAIASTFEGQKNFLVEVQSLVSSAVYGTPQRSANGFNLKRLNMLLAVLEKKCGFKLGAKDVFLNIAGGIKVSDPSLDLAVIISILSSNNDLVIDSSICFCGEVGLNGEIRPVSRVETQIKEAERLGFKKIVISSHNYNQKTKNKIIVIPCEKVIDVYDFLSKL
ncbi:MAG: DNA repair protein RadA [Flavobacteriales bacterium]|nr:DNA repair protein RadA [Flavobacteriales bacterium]